jgi:hypothetical protein
VSQRGVSRVHPNPNPNPRVAQGSPDDDGAPRGVQQFEELVLRHKKLLRVQVLKRVRVRVRVRD